LRRSTFISVLCAFPETIEDVISTLQRATEREWVFAAQRGNREAFARLVEHHGQGVLIFLSVRMNNFAEAEDLAQDTFVTAWRRLADFDVESPLGPWLRGIARHLMQNHWRKRRAEAIGGSEELAALLQAADDESGWEQCPESLEALRYCISRLESVSQLLVRKRYEEGATIEELAELTQRKPSALTMHLHRIRQTLRLCIERKLAAP
jgi:RNA polymerase sigma-70 factor (ECF subfamily)